MTRAGAAPTAVLFVPSTPTLLAEYVGGADPAGELRSRCVALLDETLKVATPGQVRIVADDGSPDVGRWTGTPLGQRVGLRLLEQAGWDRPVVFEGSSSALTPPSASEVWLIVGDGSATRTERAPGHLDERSYAVDDQVLKALSTADPQAILDVDPALAAELMVSGLPALRAVAAALLDRTDLRGELVWSGDPFGVLYWLVRWTPSRDLPGMGR